jgi:hypothetical protein
MENAVEGEGSLRHTLVKRAGSSFFARLSISMIGLCSVWTGFRGKGGRGRWRRASEHASTSSPNCGYVARQEGGHPWARWNEAVRSTT